MNRNFNLTIFLGIFLFFRNVYSDIVYRNQTNKYEASTLSNCYQHFKSSNQYVHEDLFTKTITLYCDMISYYPGPYKTYYTGYETIYVSYTNTEYFSVRYINSTLIEQKSIGPLVPETTTSTVSIYFRHGEPYYSFAFYWPNAKPTWRINATCTEPKLQFLLQYPSHILVTTDFNAEFVNCFIDTDKDNMTYAYQYKTPDQNDTFYKEWDKSWGTFQYNETQQKFTFQGNAPFSEYNNFYDVRFIAIDIKSFGVSKSFQLNFTNTAPVQDIDVDENGVPIFNSMQELFNDQYPHPRPNDFIEFAIGYYMKDLDNDTLVYQGEYYNQDTLQWDIATSQNQNLWMYYNETSFSFDGIATVSMLSKQYDFRLKACDAVDCSEYQYFSIEFLNKIPQWDETYNLQQIFNGQNPNPKANEQVKFNFLDGIATDEDYDQLFYYIYYADSTNYSLDQWTPLHDDYQLHECMTIYGYQHVETAGEQYIADDGEVKYVEGCYLKDIYGNLLDGQHLHEDQWLTNNLMDRYFVGVAPEGINDSFHYLKVVLSDNVQNNTDEKIIIMDFFNYPPEMNELISPLNELFQKQVGKTKVMKQIAFQIPEQLFTDKDKDSVMIEYWYQDISNGDDGNWILFNDDFFLKYVVENQMIKLSGMAGQNLNDKQFIVNITGNDGYKYNEYNEDLTFLIDFTNQPPKLDFSKSTLQQQFDLQVPNPQVGQAVTFGIDLFYYDLEEDQITYYIEYFDENTNQFKILKNQWLYYNDITYRFYGNPGVQYMDQVYTLKFTANDGNKNSTNIQFIDIDLTNQQPYIDPTIDTLQYQFDQQILKPYQYLKSQMIFQAFFNPFKDADKNDKLTYYIEYTYDDENGVYQDIALNSWINGNPNKLFLIINAPLSMVDRIVYLKFYVSDGFKQSGYSIIKIDFSDSPPIRNPAITLQLQEQFDKINPNPQIGQHLQFSLKSVFYDSDNDFLTYNVDYSLYDQNDNLLQNWKQLQDEWLTFYEQQLLLSGIPVLKYMDKIMKFRISCTDGFKISEYLYMNINLYNQQPYINTRQQSIQEQFDFENPVTEIYKSIKFTIPGDRFLDDDESDTLEYIAQYKNKNGNWKNLENQWVSFNRQNLILKGYATIDLLDTYYYIRFYANDGYKQSDYDYLTIDFHAEAPYQDPTQLSLQQQIDYFLSNSLTQLQADKPFSFSLYDDTYADKDSTALTYQAYIRTRYQFNSDEYKQTNGNRFLQTTNDETVDVDETLRYSCRVDKEISNKFPWDPVWSDWMKIESYNQENTWLIFDQTDLKFTGTPSSQSVGDYQLKIIVSDGVKQLSDSIYFKICNTSPYLDEQLSLQQQIEKMPVMGQQWNFYINPNTFLDNDFDVLTYNVSLINGQNLPETLVFNPDTLRFNGKLNTVSKANMTNFIQRLIYDEPLEIKITATDPIGGEAYDVFYIEVSMSFERGLLMAIEYFSYFITIVGLFKFAPLAHSICCRKKYEYHFYRQAKVGQEFQKQIPYIGSETYYCKQIWQKFQLIQKQKIIKKNLSLPKDQKLEVNQWIKILFFDQNCKFSKNNYRHELEEVRSLLNYEKSFMALINEKGQSTNIYKILKYMAYVEILEQNKRLFKIVQLLQLQICQEFWQARPNSKYDQKDNEQLDTNISQKKQRISSSFLDWYYPIIQIIYYNNPRDSNLLIAKKFPKILVNKKYISQSYYDILKNNIIFNNKKYGSQANQSLNQNQQMNDSLRNQIQQNNQDQNDPKILEQQQQAEIELIRKYIISKAQGIDIYNYKSPPEHTKGECVIQHSKELDLIQAKQKVEKYTFMDKMRSKLGFLKLDYQSIALADNLLIPNWLNVQITHDCLILYGTPSMNDIGDIKIQLYSKSGYIIREFFIRVNGPQYIEQIDQQNFVKGRLFRDLKKKVVVEEICDPNEYKNMFKNDIEGLQFSSSSESEQEEEQPQVKVDLLKQQLDEARNLNIVKNQNDIVDIKEKKLTKKQKLLSAYNKNKGNKNNGNSDSKISRLNSSIICSNSQVSSIDNSIIKIKKSSKVVQMQKRVKNVDSNTLLIQNQLQSQIQSSDSLISIDNSINSQQSPIDQNTGLRKKESNDKKSRYQIN